MSTNYKHSHEVPTAVLAKRLEELSDSVCKQDEERDRNPWGHNEALVREIHHFVRDALEVAEQREHALRERNALAAHVERLTACANAVYVANNVGDVAGFDKLLDAVDESPTTSLARLKAQWQAEALDEVADMAEKTVLTIHPSVLRQWANRKRRQAEELVDD